MALGRAHHVPGDQAQYPAQDKGDNGDYDKVRQLGAE
jgi:hypothetical protein